MRSSPEVMSSSPEIMRSSVDLPQPDGPTKTTNSPSETSRSMPLMIWASPKDFSRFLRLNCDMIASPAKRSVAGRPPPGGDGQVGGRLLILLEFASGPGEGVGGLGLAGHDGLDHFDHHVLQADIVGQQGLGTTEFDTVEEGLPGRIG